MIYFSKYFLNVFPVKFGLNYMEKNVVDGARKEINTVVF